MPLYNPSKSVMKVLTFLISLVSIYTSCKFQKTRGFLMFPGGIERGQWHEIAFLTYPEAFQKNKNKKKKK